MSSVTPVNAPTLNWAAKNLAQEYDRFEMMCDMMFSGPLVNVKAEKEQFSYICLWAGPKAIELYSNATDKSQKPGTIKDLLKTYCKPTVTTFWSARMAMRNIAQASDENFSDYANRVSSLATQCEWSNKDEQIICALIFGAKHKEAQRRALQKDKSVKVSEIITHFTSYEYSDKQQNELKDKAEVHAVSAPRCRYCDKSHARNRCKAYGHQCRICHMKHYFESVCEN